MVKTGKGYIIHDNFTSFIISTIDSYKSLSFFSIYDIFWLTCSNLDGTSLRDDSEKKDPCDGISAVDKANAEKEGVIDYDTDIGDDIDMDIPTDPEERLCKGIKDSAALLGAQTGPELMNMISTMAQLLLSKSVVNEETLIETPQINIYTKMTLGKDLGEKHILARTANHPWIQFPKDFCLDALNSNNTCESAAGIAAIVYETNPMATLPTSPRLAPNTQVIDLTVSNRENRIVDITGS